MSDLPHLFVTEYAQPLNYTANRARTTFNLPQRNRLLHSEQLIARFDTIRNRNEESIQQRQALLLPTRDGSYLEFKSLVNHDLITKSLENITQGVRLLNVRDVLLNGNKETFATVFVPRGQEQHFLNKVIDYRDHLTANGNPKNQPLVVGIEDVREALIECLWTDPVELLPEANRIWCEIWIRISQNETTDSFTLVVNELGLEFKPNYLEFPERAVILVRANRNDLNELFMRSNQLAELRLGQEPNSFWIGEGNLQQAQWANNLLDRVVIEESNIAIGILDSGINQGHPLLNQHLSADNCLSVEPNWGVHDHEHNSGHGTMMGGIALYGNVREALLSQESVIITHKLCSVKVLPPPQHADTPVELWGLKTEQAISLAEIVLPNDKIVYCLAVTSETDIDRGRPSSWSGSIDKIAYGEGTTQRLLLVSSGNIYDELEWRAYPDSNVTKSVQNPAQAWNCLTIGAYTEHINISDQENYPDNIPLSPLRCLSPYSTTSVIWANKWPNKPDVVFEGGNILRAPDDSFTQHHDLSILSTSKQFNHNNHFDTFSATSAATAQAGWMSAKIMEKYPQAWPETVRGLLVHSASWPNELLAQFNLSVNRKADVKKLIRICGYGVPQLTNALFSSETSLNYIAQEHMQPFTLQGGMNEMHYYNLPWPVDELNALGDIKVTIKITLSYFIEPGPGEIGWKDKYRYQSHGLRFDLSNATDTEDIFKSRVNAAMRDEDLDHGIAGSDRWTIGKQGRSLGSIHSDSWTEAASIISACNKIAVYPVVGWWRERRNLKKMETLTRYSLIVSITTPDIDTDIYSPIEALINVPVNVPVEITTY